MNTSKGFTIIELIVVIAIIAVLAGIVMVNVTQYINKSKDAAAEGNLATIMTNAAVWADTHTGYSAYMTQGAYNSVTPCAGDASFTTACSVLVASNMGYTVTTKLNLVDTPTVGTPAGTYWCAYVTLKSGNTYCVDSTGAKVNKAGGSCSANGGCI